MYGAVGTTQYDRRVLQRKEKKVPRLLIGHPFIKRFTVIASLNFLIGKTTGCFARGVRALCQASDFGQKRQIKRHHPLRINIVMEGIF